MSLEPNQDLEQDNERVREIILPFFNHVEAGLEMELRDMHIYLLNEEDFSIIPDDFDPEQHEHAIPRFEMARIYLLLCARTGGSLGFKPEDRDSDPAYPIYEEAYRRASKLESQKHILLALAKIGQECGFLSEHQLKELH